MAQRTAKRRLAAWEVSDAFWVRVEPLIPARQREADKGYVRKPGGGRKPKEARVVFSAVMYVQASVAGRRAWCPAVDHRDRG